MALTGEPDEIDDKGDTYACKITEHQAIKDGGCFAVEINTAHAEDDELCKPGDQN